MESHTAGLKEFFTLKELRGILCDVKDSRPDVRIKFRLNGRGWQPKFYVIAQVSEMSVGVLDDSNNELKFINLADVTQFTLDRIFQTLPAHSHYDILL